MNDEAISVIAFLYIKPGTESRFKEELAKVIAATRKEEACINYDFHQLADDPTRFVAYENWTSRAGLDQHAKSDHIQTFRKNCAEIFAQPTEITIWKKLD